MKREQLMSAPVDLNTSLGMATAQGLWLGNCPHSMKLNVSLFIRNPK